MYSNILYKKARYNQGLKIRLQIYKKKNQNQKHTLIAVKRKTHKRSLKI